MEPLAVGHQAGGSTIQRILDNALEHFSNYGYKGASVREITQASKVTKPTLYYYFKNKEELYTQLAATCFEKIFSTLDSAAHTGVSTAERILNLIREYSRLCQDQYPVVKFTYLIGISPERGTPDVGVVSFGKRITGLVDQIIQDGVRKGEVLAGSAECISYALNGIMLLRITSLLSKTREQADFSMVENAVRCVLKGSH